MSQGMVSMSSGVLKAPAFSESPWPHLGGGCSPSNVDAGARPWPAAGSGGRPMIGPELGDVSLLWRGLC